MKIPKLVSAPQGVCKGLRSHTGSHCSSLIFPICRVLQRFRQTQWLSKNNPPLKPILPQDQTRGRGGAAKLPCMPIYFAKLRNPLWKPKEPEVAHIFVMQRPNPPFQLLGLEQVVNTHRSLLVCPSGSHLTEGGIAQPVRQARSMQLPSEDFGQLGVREWEPLWIPQEDSTSMSVSLGAVPGRRYQEGRPRAEMGK